MEKGRKTYVDLLLFFIIITTHIPEHLDEKYSSGEKHQLPNSTIGKATLFLHVLLSLRIWNKTSWDFITAFVCLGSIYLTIGRFI